MAKVHYIIDSRKKAKIVKKVYGKTSIVIDEVVKLEENGIKKLDYAEFINSSENKGKKSTFDEYIGIILYSIAVILFVML